LGLITGKNIVFTGSEDDENLEVNAAMLALSGAVKWSGSDKKSTLCVFGSRCSSKQTYRCSEGTGYIDNGIYVYDERLRTNPPPEFLTIPKPLYVGLEIVK
ncbi:MAG: hypothetical protein ABIH42_00895, partial [Planctomycetota bacterium]